MASATIDFSNRIPRFIRWGIIFVVIGITFPIYGTPALFGVYRITFFRLGLIFLILAVVRWRIDLVPLLKKIPIALFVGLFFIRFVSLTISPEFLIGVKQLSWYFQGLLCCCLLVAIVRKYPYSGFFIHSKLISLGTVAALLTSFQYWLYLRGTVWSLPKSQTDWGVGYDHGGWYPLGAGGRILGPFYDPNMTGTYFVFLLCLLIPTITYAKIKNQWFNILALGFVIMAIIGSGSRQAFVVLLIIIIINYITSVLHLSLIKSLTFFVILIIGVNYFISYISTIMDYYIFNPNKGDLISRLVYGIQLQGLTDDRLYYIKRLLNSLDFSIFLFGTGEGTGEWAAHNAYLIVLQENGLYALTVLVLASLFMFFKALKKAAKSSNHVNLANIEKASILIVSAWIGIITLNWAQLNQPFPWVFLALALIFTENHRSKRISKL